MLNYETILSSYDDRLTLMQWLKKVEAALAGAALSSVSISQPTETTAIFTFNFADGTALSSPSLSLPRGLQGVSVTGASIQSGHLILTLSNGEEIDAGSMYEGDVDIHGQLLVRGDIVANGKISAPEIVEINEGYSFRASVAGANFDIKYAGAVKTGNKLTLAVSGIVTKGAGMYASMGQFIIPPAVRDLLVPLRDNIVDTHRIYVNNVTSQQGTEMDTGLGKGSGPDTLDIYTYGTNNLAEGVQYIFRYEVTFLLSDNLA